MVTKKISERSITKLFLENINTNQTVSQEEDLVIQDIQGKEKPNNKQQALDLLNTGNEKNVDFGEQATKMLTKLVSTPQTWTGVSSAIEEFRKNVRDRDSFDNSANPTQVGMASVLHVLFSLVVETDLLIEPVDVNIIITAFKNNFTNQNQLDALELLLKQLNVDI